MTGQVDHPMQELVASGLHRLAQPISSALWSVELADAPAVAPLPHVAGEMRRAAGILHVLRSLIEASTSYPETALEDLAATLAKVHAEVGPQLQRTGLEFEPAEITQSVFVNMNAQGFAESYRLLLEKFLWLGVTSGVLTETLHCDGNHFTLVLQCESEVIAGWSKIERDRLLQELDPFDTPGFDFSSRTAPELTQARAILASASIELTATAAGSAVVFSLLGSFSRQ